MYNSQLASSKTRRDHRYGCDDHKDGDTSGSVQIPSHYVSSRKKHMILQVTYVHAIALYNKAKNKNSVFNPVSFILVDYLN